MRVSDVKKKIMFRRGRPGPARVAVVIALVGTALTGLAGPASAAVSPLTGRLIVSTTTVAAGTPFTVTEEATNRGTAPLSSIKTAVSHPPFTVVGHTAPATVLGGCREMQAWLYCLGAHLAPGETQSNTYVLVANTPGTYVIQGQTVQVTGGNAGFADSVTITVT